MGYARDVTARPIETGDKAEPDRIAAHFEDNRNGRGRCLCRERRRGTRREDQVHLALDQIGCQRGEPVVLILSEAIVDRDILRLYKTGLRLGAAERRWTPGK